MDERTYKRLIAKAFGKAQKITNRGTYECLYPNSREVAIKSHSQQRLGALRSIAEEGLVYSVQRNHYQVMKRLPNTTVMVPTGISEASIFIGFCPDHDRLIFEPLEKIPLEPSNKKQPFLLLFRSFCYEYATKRKVRDWTRTLYKEVETFARCSPSQVLASQSAAKSACERVTSIGIPSDIAVEYDATIAIRAKSNLDTNDPLKWQNRSQSFTWAAEFASVLRSIGKRQSPAPARLDEAK